MISRALYRFLLNRSRKKEEERSLIEERKKIMHCLGFGNFNLDIRVLRFLALFLDTLLTEMRVTSLWDESICEAKPFLGIVHQHSLAKISMAPRSAMRRR